MQSKRPVSTSAMIMYAVFAFFVMIKHTSVILRKSAVEGFDLCVYVAEQFFFRTAVVDDIIRSFQFILPRSLRIHTLDNVVSADAVALQNALYSGLIIHIHHPRLICRLDVVRYLKQERMIVKDDFFLQIILWICLPRHVPARLPKRVRAGCDQDIYVFLI